MPQVPDTKLQVNCMITILVTYLLGEYNLPTRLATTKARSVLPVHGRGLLLERAPKVVFVAVIVVRERKACGTHDRSQQCNTTLAPRPRPGEPRLGRGHLETHPRLGMSGEYPRHK